MAGDPAARAQDEQWVGPPLDDRRSKTVNLGGDGGRFQGYESTTFKKLRRSMRREGIADPTAFGVVAEGTGFTRDDV